MSCLRPSHVSPAAEFSRPTVDVRAELDAWEARYGVPSDRLADAFMDSTGSLADTDDFHAWSQTYNGWLRVVGR